MKIVVRYSCLAIEDRWSVELARRVQLFDSNADNFMVRCIYLVT